MKVGSLVECTSDNFYTAGLPIKCPTIKTIYTVRDIDSGGSDGDTILLEELINKALWFTDGYKEPSFDITAFREIQPPMVIDIESLIEQPLEHECH